MARPERHLWVDVGVRLTGVTKSVTMCAGMEEAYQCLGVVTVGHDDVPVTRVRQMLGSM